MAALAAGGGYLGRVETGDPDIWVLRFREPGGVQTWAVWSAHPDDGWQVTLKAPRPEAPPLALREAGRTAFQRPWGSRNWVEARGTATAAPDQLAFVVRGMPWLITGAWKALPWWA